MNREGMRRPETGVVLPISDNRVQMFVAQYAFGVEHAGVAASRNEIMKEWVEVHAADWRKIVEAHEGENLSLNDKETIARYYAEMLHKHDESDSPTVH